MKVSPYTTTTWFQVRMGNSCFLWIQTLDHSGCGNTAYQVNSPALNLLSHWDMSKRTCPVALHMHARHHYTGQTYTFLSYYCFHEVGGHLFWCKFLHTPCNMSIACVFLQNWTPHWTILSLSKASTLTIGELREDAGGKMAAVSCC